MASRLTEPPRHPRMTRVGEVVDGLRYMPDWTVECGEDWTECNRLDVKLGVVGVVPDSRHSGPDDIYVSSPTVTVGFVYRAYDVGGWSTERAQRWIRDRLHEAMGHEVDEFFRVTDRTGIESRPFDPHMVF